MAAWANGEVQKSGNGWSRSTSEAGVEIGRATLDGWVMRVGELLRPVTQAMRQDLLTATYLPADETTVPVQLRDKSGANHQAYLWPYGQPGGETVFEFCLGRGSFWASGRACSKATVISPMTGSAGRG